MSIALQLQALVFRYGLKCKAWLLSKNALEARASQLMNKPLEGSPSSDHPPSAEMVAFVEMLTMLKRPVPSDFEKASQQWRDNLLGMEAIFASLSGQSNVPRAVHATNCPVPGCVWFCAPVHEAPAAILFLHGGGYSTGNALTYSPFCGHLSRSLNNTPVLSVEYPLMPAASIPQQVDSAVMAYNWLVSLKGSPRVVICGDSAGGGLAALTLQRLKSHPNLAGGVLVSPWMDLNLAGDTYKNNDTRDLSLGLAWMKHLQKVLGQHPEHNFESAEWSALRGSWAGVPPLYIWVAEAECLCSDSITAAAHAKESGVQVELKVRPWAFHETPMWQGAVPEAAEAVRDIAGFCRKVLPVVTGVSRF